MSAADIKGVTRRRFAIPIGVGICGCVAALGLWLADEASDPGGSLVIGPEHACPSRAAAAWSAGGGANGNKWAVVTNLASCDVAGERVAEVAGKGIIELADVTGFRCTAEAMRGGQTLAGICYASETPAGYIAWGADVPPYNRPGPCDRCIGVPGEQLSSAAAEDLLPVGATPGTDGGQ